MQLRVNYGSKMGIFCKGCWPIRGVVFVTGSMSPTMVPKRTMANSKFTPVNGNFFSPLFYDCEITTYSFGWQCFHTVYSLVPNLPGSAFVSTFHYFPCLIFHVFSLLFVSFFYDRYNVVALKTFHVFFSHCFSCFFLRPGQCCGLENFSCLMSRRDLFTASKKVAVERIWWQNGFTRLGWLGWIIIYLKSGGTLRTPISCWSPFFLRHWGHHGLAMWPTPQSIWEASVLDRWASIT